MRDVFDAPAILLIGNNPTEQHPLLAWQIRTNVRLHRAKLYVVNSYPIKLRRQATAFAQIASRLRRQLGAVPRRKRRSRRCGDHSAAHARGARRRCARR